MATRYPVIIVDKNNETRIQGFVEFTDPATTPVFNGGTITKALTIAPTSTASAPLTVNMPVGASAAGQNSILVERETTGNVLRLDCYGDLSLEADTVDPTNGGGVVACYDHLGTVKFEVNADNGAGGSAPLFTSPPAPATQALVSGAGAQLNTDRNVDSVTPFTGDATNNAATCKIEISPDNVTYTTLNTVSIAAALNFTGALDQSINVMVPGQWYLRLTATHGTIGTTTYY